MRKYTNLGRGYKYLFLFSFLIIGLTALPILLQAEGEGEIQSVDEVVDMANNAFPGVVTPVNQPPSSAGVPTGQSAQPKPPQSQGTLTWSGYVDGLEALGDQREAGEITDEQFEQSVNDLQQRYQRGERNRRSVTQQRGHRPVDVIGVQTEAGVLAPKTPVPMSSSEE